MGNWLWVRVLKKALGLLGRGFAVPGFEESGRDDRMERLCRPFRDSYRFRSESPDSSPGLVSMGGVGLGRGFEVGGASRGLRFLICGNSFEEFLNPAASGAFSNTLSTRDPEVGANAEGLEHFDNLLLSAYRDRGA